MKYMDGGIYHQNIRLNLSLKERECMNDISVLLKIGGAGIILLVLDKVLTSSGKGEIAAITNIAGVVIILLMIVSIIGDLFSTLKTMFIM